MPRFAPSLRLPLRLVLLALAATAPLAGETTSKIEPLDKKTVAVTDLTDAGRELPIPSPAQPVYYVGINAGYRAYSGNVLAGDPPPDPKVMLRTIAQVLADQGFRAATPAQPATQIIVCSWGVIGSGGRNLLGPGSSISFLGGQKLSFVNESSITGTGPTLMEAMTRNMASGTADTIREMSHDTLYAVLLRAYDLKAAQEGRTVQLWETRIACSSPGTNLAEALPRVVVSGQHVIGRETAQPVLENAAHTQQAWVEIGESTVVEYLDLADLVKAEGAAREQPREQPLAPEPPTPAPAPTTK